MEIDLIINRVGIGPTHRWMMFILCAIEVVVGFQIVMISLIAPHLKIKMNLSDEVANIPLSLYLGIIVGSLMSGSMANQVGRKPTLMTGLGLMGFSSALMIVSHEFVYLLSSLFGVGIGIGICLVTSSALMSEQYPQRNRGRALLFLSFISIGGKLSAILFSYAEQNQNWISSQYFICFFAFIGIIFVGCRIPESIRMLLMKGQTKKSLQIISKLLKQQQKEDVNYDEVKKLGIWAAEHQKITAYDSSYKQILNNKMYMKTLMLSITWFMINFLFYGQLFIMPFIFQKQGGIAYFAVMICGEIPSIFLTSSMIENEKLGRRNSLALFFTLAALLNFGLIYYQNINLIALSRLAMKSIFQILYPYTTESFSTRSRAHGLAFCGGVGRLGSIIMPMIIFPLFKIDSYLVFVIFMAASMVGLYSSLSGHETLNRNIDDLSLEFQREQAVNLSNNEEIEQK